MKKINNAKKAHSIFRKICKICITAFITFVIIIIFLGVINHLFAYVQLPNGIRISKSFLQIGGETLVLKKSNGEFIAEIESDYISHLGDFVFGNAVSVKSLNQEGMAFIYKNNWQYPLIFRTGSEYDSALEKYELGDSISIPPDISERANYKKCLNRHDENSCKFAAYDEYWSNVNIGVENQYQCKTSKTEVCVSYGIDKNFLSLMRMSGYRRNWYE